MANISDAFGDITIAIKNDNTKLLKDFTYLFDKVLGIENACYYTATNGWEYQANEAHTTFDGTGRWTYQNNAEMTYEWIKNGIPRIEDETVRAKLQDIWSELNKVNWEIYYEFKDEECGCECLYETECWVRHSAGKEEAEFIEGNMQSYDYTPENLVELGFQDGIEEAKEYMGIEEE